MTVNSIVITDDDDEDDDDEDAQEACVHANMEIMNHLELINDDNDDDAPLEFDEVEVGGTIRLGECDLDGAPFQHENEIFSFMEQGPPPRKRGRTNLDNIPRNLAAQDNF
jgi:hypothetical protein